MRGEKEVREDDTARSCVIGVLTTKETVFEYLDRQFSLPLLQTDKFSKVSEIRAEIMPYSGHWPRRFFVVANWKLKLEIFPLKHPVLTLNSTLEALSSTSC